MCRMHHLCIVSLCPECPCLGIFMALSILIMCLLVCALWTQNELEARDEVGRYMCKAAHCLKGYTAFDIPSILQPDGGLMCEMCGGHVEQVFSTGQTGSDAERRRRREVRMQ